MGAAERIEWQGEHPALLHSEHPCNQVWDEHEALLWWSDHPALSWSDHPCDALWDAVDPELLSVPANDNGGEPRESGTKNKPPLALLGNDLAQSNKKAATPAKAGQTLRETEAVAKTLRTFPLPRAARAEVNEGGARALSEKCRHELSTAQGEAQPAQAQAAHPGQTVCSHRSAEQAGGWGLPRFEVSHFTVVPYLMANGVRLARLVYHGSDEVPEEDVSTDGSYGDVNASVSNLHVFFELGDHLGSTSVVLDKATGELVERATFQGYGGAESDYRPGRWKSFREDYRFTGKEEDVEVGLQYFGKRYLNPLLGRWVSADPLAVHAPGQANLNLYAYVSGAVLKATDPLGLCGPNESCPVAESTESSVSSSMSMQSNADGTVGHEDGTTSTPGLASDETERDGKAAMAGPGGTTLHDTGQRAKYTKEIKEMSDKYVAAVDQAEAAGDLDAAEDAARSAHAERNQIRSETQKRLTPGGKQVSEALDRPPSWDSMTKKKGTGSFDAYREIAKSAGKSSEVMKKYVTPASKVAGPVMTGVGLVAAGANVAAAPEGEKLKTAAKEGSIIGASAIGGTAGAAGGAAFGSGLAVGLGLAAGPAGWVALGFAVIGGGALGWAAGDAAEGAWGD